jgi:hypothetical protein
MRYRFNEHHDDLIIPVTRRMILKSLGKETLEVATYLDILESIFTWKSETIGLKI